MYPCRTISIDTCNSVYSDRVMKKICVRVKSDAFFNPINVSVSTLDALPCTKYLQR